MDGSYSTGGQEMSFQHSELSLPELALLLEERHAQRKLRHHAMRRLTWSLLRLAARGMAARLLAKTRRASAHLL